MRTAYFLGLVLLTACGGSKQNPSSPSPAGSTASTSTPTSDTPAASTDKPATTDDKPVADAPKPAAADKMDGALPETKDAKPFPRRFECAGKGCNLATIVPDSMKGQIEKDAPIFMFEVVMPPKVMMLTPKNSGLDLYGMLLDGEVSVMADDIKDKQKRCWRLNGFHAPGVGVNIYSKEPTRMILAVVVAGTSGSVAAEIDKKAPWTKRSSPVTSFELSAKNDIAWGGGAYHARLAYEEPPAAMGWLMMSKNANVPEHTHDKEWEFLAVVDGEGELNRKTGGKTPINGSTFLSINPGNPHSFKASGGKPTMAIQMYWPPGPEQRFKKLAEAK
jgi:mannose-6-phosphate isomerase-like protein (cupin superfamily)